MPIDWNTFNNELDIAIINAANATDKKLASQISSITRLTDDEIQELFPEPADVKKLTQLLEIVKSAEDRNTKINKIVDNSEEFGGIVLTLLEKLA
ncbi:hypothetical protein MAH1_00210 [Sessilibacter sp. MAH1]